MEARARLSRLIRKLERAAESRVARLHAHRDRRQRRALSGTPGNADSVACENKVGGASAGQYSGVCHAAARTVQTHWRAVLHSNRNTAALVEGFQNTGLTRTVQNVSSPQPLNPPGEQSVESFDRIAEILSSPRTIKATASLLERIECLLHILIQRDGHLHNSTKDKHKHRHGQVRHKVGGRHSSRYQVRPFLSAYMILTHPHVVLNGATRNDGFRLLRKEAVLWTAAKALISSFHGFKAVFLVPVKDQTPLRLLLTNFEQSWVHYIHQFYVWKGRDAMALEAQLIQAAMELESSRRIKLASRRPSTDKRASNDDMRALSQGVDHDLDLIGRRVFQLAGKEGATRLEVALKAVNAGVEAQSLPSASSSPPSSASSGFSSPEGEGAMYAQMPQMGSNASLAWQLLYDKSWRISSEALENEWELLLASSLDEKSKASDTIKGKEEENHSVTLQPLMDAMDGVATLLPPPHSAGKVDYRREVAHLEEEITSAVEKSANEVVKLVDAAFRLALALGSPARDGPAKEAYHALHQGLSHPENDRMKNFTLEKAVKLVSIQWRLLRIDLANTYLSSLATKFGGEYQDLYDCARTKLNLSVSNVPNTLAWMALSSSRAALLPSIVDHGTAKATIKEPFQCPKLRSGRTLVVVPNTEKTQRWDSSSIGNDSMERIPCPTENWQRTLRVGLVLWIAGQGPFTKIELPETLRLDVARLHAAKVEFQRTLVLGIVLDLDLDFDLDIKRLRAILASPDIDIDDIVTEVVCQKGKVHGSSKGEADKEKGVRDVLKSKLSPHSIAIQDWTEYLTDELIRQVNCLGGSSHDRQHQHNLSADVHSIGSILLKIASVHERVFGDLYCGLDQSLSA